MPYSSNKVSNQSIRSVRRIDWSLLNPYILLAPAFIFMGVFIFWPVGYSLVLSTMDWKLGYAHKEFIFFGNYIKLFGSPDFWNSMLRTLIYTSIMGSLSIGLGLILSLAIISAKRFNSVWQAVFFLPVTATMAAMALVWRFVFDTHIGIINALLVKLGGNPVEWLSQGSTAMGVVILIGVWSNAGYAMVFFIAGLSAIPKTLYEAASIDGANGIRRFLSITWPMLSPTTLFIIIIMTTRALAGFDIVKVLTNGGPVNATQVLSLFLYQEAFQFFDTGYASGIAVIFFIIVLFLALLQMRVEKWVHYN